MINGRLYFKDTHLPEILHLGRSTLDVRIRTLMMIDSLDMTDQDREIILMRHYDHLSNLEISEVLGLNRPAASMRYLRALRRLRELLEDADSSGAAGYEDVP